MLRHVVLFKLKPDVTGDQIAAMEEGLAGLPGTIRAIRRYEFGRDLGLADGNYDLALVADFDDTEGWRAYSPMRPTARSSSTASNRWSTRWCGCSTTCEMPGLLGCLRA